MATILVVDDSRSDRRLAARCLDRTGFEVVEAASGRHALDLMSSVRPDAVVTDLVMPELDGFQTCAGIREHPRGALTPILIIWGAIFMFKTM